MQFYYSSARFLGCSQPCHPVYCPVTKQTRAHQSLHELDTDLPDKFVGALVGELKRVLRDNRLRLPAGVFCVCIRVYGHCVCAERVWRQSVC